LLSTANHIVESTYIQYAQDFQKTVNLAKKFCKSAGLSGYAASGQKPIVLDSAAQSAALSRTMGFCPDRL